MGQRFEDWFLLRQFRITWTNSYSIVLHKIRLREAIFIPEPSTKPKTLPDRLSFLSASWFSRNRSPEEIIRGSEPQQSLLIKMLFSALYILKRSWCGMCLTLEWWDPKQKRRWLVRRMTLFFISYTQPWTQFSMDWVYWDRYRWNFVSSFLWLFSKLKLRLQIECLQNLLSISHQQWLYILTTQQ